MMAAAPAAGAAAALRGRAERRDYRQLLAEISAPTLVVVGRDDEFTPVRDAEYMHQRIPTATLAVIDRAGHLPNLEQPTAFNTALRTFLSKLDSGGGS
jgi:3-oxoadipate enol-lactonase